MRIWNEFKVRKVQIGADKLINKLEMDHNKYRDLVSAKWCLFDSGPDLHVYIISKSTVLSLNSCQEQTGVFAKQQSVERKYLESERVNTYKSIDKLQKNLIFF